MKLTPKEIRTRVNLAIKLDAAGLDEHFSDSVTALFEDLIQAIAYGRCDDPQAACRQAARLFCLNALGPTQ